MAEEGGIVSFFSVLLILSPNRAIYLYSSKLKAEEEGKLMATESSFLTVTGLSIIAFLWPSQVFETASLSSTVLCRFIRYNPDTLQIL